MKITSPIKQEEKSMREGILTVLHDDQDHAPPNKPFPPSIRRTLSADMSSKKWLAQNKFFTPPPPPKDDAEFANNNNRRPPPSPPCKEGAGESNPSQDDVWRSIVRSQNDNQNIKVVGGLFVPPSLMKKRSLREKSLEICTESLGSETGSDSNLSSYGSSSEFDGGGGGGDCQEPEKIVTTQGRQLSDKFEIVPAVKYKNAPPNRPFPPPIRSSLSMSCRRDGGRLVVEAASGPPRSRFVAQRGNGRLVLQEIGRDKEDRSYYQPQITTTPPSSLTPPPPKPKPQTTMYVIATKENYSNNLLQQDSKGGCKELKKKRSFFYMWGKEPYCIATS